jgi:hypothetical protein
MDADFRRQARPGSLDKDSYPDRDIWSAAWHERVA